MESGVLKNFKIVIEYDGSDFHGWQRQRTEITVQAEIERALATMTGAAVRVTGSGRTDAGVHAYGQVAGFTCETRLNAEQFLKGLNSLLPEAIVIKTCEQAHDGFHARYDVKSKIYRYRILNRTLPAAIGRQYAWHIRRPLDLELMDRAAGMLVGEHDFKAFEGTGSPRAHAVRIVYRSEVFRYRQDMIFFEIEANGFLKFMVRNIVGTLIPVGHGEIQPNEFKKILASRNREKAGATAPPHGLVLVSVQY